MDRHQSLGLLFLIVVIFSSPLVHGFFLEEPTADHVRIKRQIPTDPGVYVWKVNQVLCELSDDSRRKASEECRSAVGLPPEDKKEDGGGETSSTPSVEFEIVVDGTEEQKRDMGQSENGRRRRSEGESTSWWRRAWNSVKNGAQSLWQRMKDFGSRVKTRVSSYFQDSKEDPSEVMNKVMGVDQCMAKKLNLVDGEGLPQKELVQKHVEQLVGPTGKPLVRTAASRLNECVGRAVESASNPMVGDPDSKLTCLRDPECKSNYRAGQCIKFALMEHCMAVGGGRKEAMTTGPSKRDTHPAKVQQDH